MDGTNRSAVGCRLPRSIVDGRLWICLLKKGLLTPKMTPKMSSPLRQPHFPETSTPPLKSGPIDVLHCFPRSTTKRPDLCTVLVVDIPNTTMLSNQCTHTLSSIQPQRPQILHRSTPIRYRSSLKHAVAKSHHPAAEGLIGSERPMSPRTHCPRHSAPPRPGPDRPRFHGQSEVTHPAHGSVTGQTEG